MVELGDTRQQLVSANISAGGMKLRTRDPAAIITLDPGQIVTLEFSLPLLSAPVVAQGEVRWADADTCGIQFIDLSPRVVSAINRLQWRR